MLIIAHRGASFDAPENTLAAVRLAWHQRADAVEIDVHLSKDGRLVVIHDDNTRRTAGLRRKVASQTFAELHKLDAGRWKGDTWLREHIPSLDEVLSTLPRGKRLFIEFKARADCASALASALVHARCQPEQIVLIGFSLRAMQALKRAFPKHEVCWLVALKRDVLGRAPSAAKLIRKIHRAGLDGLDLQANRFLTPSLIKKIRLSGLKLYAWTVDSPATARKLAQAGVDGITTNRPGWLRKQW